MLLAEELLLLSLNPVTGRRSVGKAALEPGLAGALVAELVLAERVGVDPDTLGRWHASRIVVVCDKPTDDAELDRALASLCRHEGRKVRDLVRRTGRDRLSKGLPGRLLTRLTAETVLVERTHYALGVIPRAVWPMRDPSRLRPLHDRLAAALVHGETPAERTTALIGLLGAMGHVASVVPDANRRAVRRRAAELSDGDWVAAAVRKAVQDASDTPTGVG